MIKRKIKSSKKTSFGVLGTIGAILLGKLKYVLVVLKLLKLQTLLSMFITLGSYALIFGWEFAVAIVYLLFIHEMGHAYAAKRIKLPVSPAIFIPFMGAVIGMKEMPKSAKDEGFVAYMGPLFGLISFLPAIPLYVYTHEPFWALLIILGGMINLFNLIPITPLDGGRIAAGISTKLWGLGIILLLAYSIYKLSFIGFIIVLLGSREWYKLYKKQKRLKDDQLEVQELEILIENISLESHSLDSTYDMIRKSKWKIANLEISQLLNTLTLEIEKMKKDLYLQQLSGTYHLSDEAIHYNQPVILDILNQLEEKLSAYKKDIMITKSYYKTDKKTKLQLFLIYIGLVLALTISYYYGNEILMNHPEIQNELNK
ncbi:site-2 protease family protein [Bacillus sp. ISL-18]|nr:site-2 protease family protein [Bacillus sp. ISL-18]MBT2655456.1 site-2 protease family protein [Bacillus sp. ISL-18]